MFFTFFVIENPNPDLLFEHTDLNIIIPFEWAWTL